MYRSLLLATVVSCDTANLTSTPPVKEEKADTGMGESKPPNSETTGNKHQSGYLQTMRLWLLGEFRVSVGPRTITRDTWRLKKAASLAKLLALAEGHRLHSEQMVEYLWPDLAPKAASNNLRGGLYAARRALEPEPTGSRNLVLRDGWLALRPEGRLWGDAEAFEEATRTARRVGEPAAYRAAIDLYAGELLPEDRYEEWTEERREGLRRMHLSLLVELAALYEERGEREPAIASLGRVVETEPANEEAHVGLMRLYAAEGRRHEGMVQYERLRRALSEVLHAEPGEAARALYERIAAGRSLDSSPSEVRSIAPAERSAGRSPRHNLPAERTSFVGREEELVEVGRLLSMTRLLTLVGAGGSGKTRFALRVARGLAGTYADGIWLVELAPLSNPELLEQAVASVLGVREEPDPPLTATLKEHLSSREVLLILDNCEHLIEAAARLVESLLDSCEGLRILVTSREALNVEGELVWQVAPLPVPDTLGAPTVGELAGYGSVRLFVERARLRRPQFELTQEDAEAVAEICRILDGMPLAIELAAARAGALSAEQIVSRLGYSLELLEGSRTASPRQRTLEGTMDWSFGLLSERERELFSRLSVFAGGWSLEAMVAVSDEVDPLDVLLSLVDKSLVVAEARAGDGLRYRMLEPVRQYGQKRLEKSGEAERVRGRHAQYYLTLAEEAEPELAGPREVEKLELLEAEHDNLRTAFSWALEREEAELGLRIAAALWPFWEAHGHYREGARRLEEVLEKGDQASPARIKALEGLSRLVHHQGDLARAEAAAREGLGVSVGAGAENKRALFLLELGSTAYVRGDYERTKELLEESLTLSRRVGDRRLTARALLALASATADAGDFRRAMELYEEGLSISRRLGSAYPLGTFLINMGYQYLLQGDPERATALNAEAANLYRQRGHKGKLQYALDNLGWSALARGDHRQAEALHRECLALCQELGERTIAAECLEGLACAAGARGEASRAARLFGAGEAQREAVGFQHLPAERALREPYLAATRSRLNEAEWERAFAEGRTMPMEAATEYALSVAEEPPGAGANRSYMPQDPAQNLTRRELEIAELVARGLTNRQIAEELVISEHTAATHVRRILKKLGLQSRTQITTWVGKPL